MRTHGATVNVVIHDICQRLRFPKKQPRSVVCRDPSRPECDFLKQLDDPHLGVVTPAVPIPQHPRVPAIAIRVPFGDLLKESVNKFLVVDVSKSLAARVKRAVLRECDHVIGGLPNLLATAQSGLDASMADELSGEATQQRLALIGRLVELL